jgi:hypothetical protein
VVVDDADEILAGVGDGDDEAAAVIKTVCVAVYGWAGATVEALDGILLDVVELPDVVAGIGAADMVTVAGGTVDCDAKVVDTSTLLPDCHAMYTPCKASTAPEATCTSPSGAASTVASVRDE